MGHSSVWQYDSLGAVSALLLRGFLPSLGVAVWILGKVKSTCWLSHILAVVFCCCYGALCNTVVWPLAKELM